MARKGAEQIVFCDQCGGSIPANLSPFIMENPDGTQKTLCQECMWAAKAEEDTPTLALDDDIQIDAGAIESIHRPEDEPAEEVEVVEAARAGGPAPAGTALGGGSRYCKTFVSKASVASLEFLDDHIKEFARANKIRIKHAMCACGTASVGTKGTSENAYFVTIWW